MSGAANGKRFWPTHDGAKKPLSQTLTDFPKTINADAMTAEQLQVELLAGYEDMQNGNVQDTSIAFAQFRQRVNTEHDGAAF